MFSNAYDHGVVTALDELEKFAGEKFAGKVGDALTKAKNAITAPFSSKAQYRKNISGVPLEKRDSVRKLVHKGSSEQASKNRKIAYGVGGGTLAAGGGTAYAMSDDKKKGRTKKAEWDKEAGAGEFFGGMGQKIRGGAESAMGGIRRGAGAVHDFYSPTAIAAGRRPGAEQAMREGLESQHPQTFGRDLRQLLTGHDPVGKGMASGAAGLDEQLMSEAKRTALLRGLLTAGGAGAAGGGAYAASEYGSDD